MKNIEKIIWHPAFYGGLEYELRTYTDDLKYEHEYELSKESVRVDMLIVKKNSEKIIDDPIARIFRRYNIIEYKSPDDELSIDDFYKVIGYAGLYKGYGRLVNEISADELTISIFRHRFPRKLFESLEKLNADINEIEQGIYYINGIINIPVQIVVTRQLEAGKYEALKILTHNANEDDVRQFISEINNLAVPFDKHNADAVLQASVSANKDLYDKVRSEESMCEALRELMKDDIEKAVNEGRAKGMAEGRAKGMAEGRAEEESQERDGL